MCGLANLSSDALQREEAVALMLQIANLCKAYGQHTVLHNLNLNLAPGEVYGLLGPN